MTTKPRDERDALIEHLRRKHGMPQSRYYYRPKTTAALRKMHDQHHANATRKHEHK